MMIVARRKDMQDGFIAKGKMVKLWDIFTPATSKSLLYGEDAQGCRFVFIERDRGTGKVIQRNEQGLLAAWLQEWGIEVLR
jgi:hypothetical protein